MPHTLTTMCSFRAILDVWKLFIVVLTPHTSSSPASLSLYITQWKILNEWPSFDPWRTPIELYITRRRISGRSISVCIPLALGRRFYNTWLQDGAIITGVYRCECMSECGNICSILRSSVITWHDLVSQLCTNISRYSGLLGLVRTLLLWKRFIPTQVYELWTMNYESMNFTEKNRSFTYLWTSPVRLDEINIIHCDIN